jgi:hypothetical protein
MNLAPVILEEEEWREVPSQPLLLASSWGRVCKKASKAKMPHGKERDYFPKPTFGYERTAKKGAKHVYRGTYYKGIGNVKIHRAVCEAFHGPAPFPKAVVIHINEDAYDNRPSNLKWGTQKENLNGAKFLEYCRARKGENSPYAKARIWRAE